MLRSAVKLAAPFVVGCIALLVNLGLFSLFPFLHGALGAVVNGVALPKSGRTVVMEYRKPEEKPKVRSEKPLRKVTSSGRASGSSSLQFRFTPDLSVEGAAGVAMEGQELSAVIFEEGETDEDAVALYQPAISYPQRARELEIEGTFEAIIVLDTHGKVQSVEIVRSPHVTISNEARRTIGTWRFKPARNKGVPVRVRLRQVIEFRLE